MREPEIIYISGGDDSEEDSDTSHVRRERENARRAREEARRKKRAISIARLSLRSPPRLLRAPDVPDAPPRPDAGPRSFVIERSAPRLSLRDLLPPMPPAPPLNRQRVTTATEECTVTVSSSLASVSGVMPSTSSTQQLVVEQATVSGAGASSTQQLVIEQTAVADIHAPVPDRGEAEPNRGMAKPERTKVAKVCMRQTTIAIRIVKKKLITASEPHNKSSLSSSLRLLLRPGKLEYPPRSFHDYQQPRESFLTSPRYLHPTILRQLCQVPAATPPYPPPAPVPAVTPPFFPRESEPYRSDRPESSFLNPRRPPWGIDNRPVPVPSTPSTHLRRWGNHDRGSLDASPELVPAVWPHEVVRLAANYNPTLIEFAYRARYGFCVCTSSCKFGMCRNSAVGLFCNPGCCPFKGKCDNGLAESDKVQLRMIRGTRHLTVVATEPIEAHVVIGQYLGVLSLENASGEERESNEGYRLHLHRDENLPKGKRVCINAQNMGGLMRFLNHSCSPSAYFHEVANGYQRAVVVATCRPIAKDEEITVSYGDDLWFPCCCRMCRDNKSPSSGRAAKRVLKRFRETAGQPSDNEDDDSKDEDFEPPGKQKRKTNPSTTATAGRPRESGSKGKGKAKRRRLAGESKTESDMDESDDDAWRYHSSKGKGKAKRRRLEGESKSESDMYESDEDYGPGGFLLNDN